MKFSLTTLLVVLPLLAAQASALAVPEGNLVARQGKGKGGGQGGKRGNAAGNNAGKNAGKNAGGKGAAAGAAAAGAAAGAAAAAGKGKAASSSSAAAAAATGTAAAAAGGNATAAAAAGNNAAAGGDPQTSLTLDPNVIAKGFALDGNQVPADGQAASLTSTNNFINFCLTTKLPLTNGQQIKTGSCNPAPMGSIPSTANMPSCKFTNPKNMQDIAANTPFTITMAIQNMQTGDFVNAQNNYFSAPQQLNAQGQIIGHSHVVVEQLTALDQTTPNDPNKFAFFKGLNAAAQNGVLSADVTSGLPAGVYKLSSINSAGNHQPVLAPIAQHGSLDDAVYFTVGGAGGNAGGAAAAAAAGGAAAAANNGTAAAAGGAAAASTSAAAQASQSAAAKGNQGGKGQGGQQGKGQGGQQGKNGKNGKRAVRRFVREAY